MSKWRNYREEARRTDTAKKERKEKAPETDEETLGENVAKIQQEAANRAARLASYTTQTAQIEEAMSIARSKGIHVEGTVVGLHAMAAGIAGGHGVSVADIGIETNIEANELDPNIPWVNSESDAAGSDGNEIRYKMEPEEELEL